MKGQGNLFTYREAPKTLALSPLFKYVGGKRKLADRILSYLPKRIEGNYFEGFVGGAAVFCELANRGAITKSATLMDFNHELISLYQTVKQSLPQHLASLRRLEKEYNTSPAHAERLFFRVREEWNVGLQTPDRYAFLKSTAFNGLWRVNRSGIFNVGWGKYKSVHFDYERYEQWSWFLNQHNVKLHAGDTTKWPVSQPERGDVVYLDPPYVETFGSYTEEGFSLQQQVSLLTRARKWDSEGVCVGISNSMASKPLFEEHWPEAELVTFDVNYNVNCDGKGRANQQELFAVSKRKGT